MGIRYLVKFELVLFFVSLLILGTFLQVRLPFIAFRLPQLAETSLWFSSSWLYLGMYTGNLQIPIYFLCLLVFSGTLASITLILYLALGLFVLPIFFYGGGLEYLNQPTFGYILSLLPAAWLWMFMVRRYARGPAPLSRYISATLISLLLIHLFGGFYAAIYYQLIPLDFILQFVLPQLTWQVPAALFVLLGCLSVQEKWRELFPPTPRRRRRRA